MEGVRYVQHFNISLLLSPTSFYKVSEPLLSMMEQLNFILEPLIGA